MNRKPKDPGTTHPWDEMAQAYASSRAVSVDRLVEWPAQLKMCGPFAGKRVLDVGCGTGDKACFFAENGAATVIGVDPSAAFAADWARHARCPNLSFLAGDFATLLTLPALAAQQFELIVSFQALMYAANLADAVKALGTLLVPGGDLVISVPHPFRFAIVRNETAGGGLGCAYQKTTPFRYPSLWKPDRLLEHATPRVSDYLNALAAAGLRLTAVDEPAATEALRSAAPQKAVWMDRYVGSMIFRARRDA